MFCALLENATLFHSEATSFLTPCSYSRVLLLRRHVPGEKMRPVNKAQASISTRAGWPCGRQWKSVVCSDKFVRECDSRPTPTSQCLLLCACAHVRACASPPPPPRSAMHPDHICSAESPQERQTEGVACVRSPPKRLTNANPLVGAKEKKKYRRPLVMIK